MDKLASKGECGVEAVLHCRSNQLSMKPKTFPAWLFELLESLLVWNHNSGNSVLTA